MSKQREARSVKNRSLVTSWTALTCVHENGGLKIVGKSREVFSDANYFDKMRAKSLTEKPRKPSTSGRGRTPRHAYV